ncbi:probable caffeoyl-CoA O-methyltransferase At4g26220 isoform X3 [Mangifera indica]|uniref:probable caffeoyl-CoA O-methyltransferase At4g26220 isoform X3 n=1 Tax=Mangifera indica TaxID=29780 RepID=UPI001CF970DF|nr:probable caffeoyl-CoA O-methyltransferase At4g26220 isoform X3 [Mangifera indica]
MARMSTAPDAGQLIAILLKLLNPKKTIEIGVYTGYSLLLTAVNIPGDGQVSNLPTLYENEIELSNSTHKDLQIIAIDPDREAYEIGLPVIQKARVDHKIKFIESEALAVLDTILENGENEGQFDYAYVDADKGNYRNYHERLMKLLKVGGVCVYDNTLWAGTVAMSEEQTPEPMKAERKAILEFNKALAADPRVQLSQAPLGDGISICRRIY